ncbi:MAG: hypothetical protein AAF500_05275 [Myxococcota bacterium]
MPRCGLPVVSDYLNVAEDSRATGTGESPEPPLPTRARLMDSALRVIARARYAETTVTRIAREAGLSPGARDLSGPRKRVT